MYKPLSFTPPKPDRFVLSNGLVLYFLEDHELPLIKVTTVIRTGSIYDPQGKEGLAELTGKLVKTGGISGMTGNEVDETLESMAAALHTTVNRDSAVFSLSLLRKDLEKSIDILSRMLIKPSFEEAKLTLAKDLKIEELRRIPDDPQKLAFREFGRLMHAGSLRGRLATKDSIERIQRDDLVECHSLFHHPQRVMISISGDIGRNELETIIKRYFSGWTSSSPKVETPSLPCRQGGMIYLLPKEVPRSVVIFGWLAPSKNDSQFFSFQMLDFIIGNGGFRSRIFQEVRTNRGLAYSAGSFYTARSEYGFLGAYALIKSESTIEVISLIRRIIHDIGDKPIPHEELTRTKNAILNSYIFSFTSSDKIAFQQMMNEYDKLPDDYLMTYRNKIDKVSINDIKKVASEYLDPEKAIILVVGNDIIVQAITRSFENVIKIDGPL